MEAVLKEWGNSLAIRIPKTFLKEMNLKKDNKLEINIVDNKIVIESKDVDLQSMLNKINKNNIHKEIDFGKSEGKEVW
jgi:antitoxin MazE